MSVPGIAESTAWRTNGLYVKVDGMQLSAVTFLILERRIVFEGGKVPGRFSFLTAIGSVSFARTSISANPHPVRAETVPALRLTRSNWQI